MQKLTVSYVSEEVKPRTISLFVKTSKRAKEVCQNIGEHHIQHAEWRNSGNGVRVKII